jgi:hypothetical protein
MTIKMIKGEKFGELLFIEHKGSNGEGRKIGKFICSCGKIAIKPIGRVKCGSINTCGSGIHQRGKHIKHGMRYTPEYKTWIRMKARIKSKRPSERHYLEVGMSDTIKNSFINFFKEVGKRPSKKYSIDRIDNSKGYVEGNMRWAKIKNQAINKSSSYVVTIGGKKFNSMTEASKHFGVSVTTIIRWCDGYTDERRPNSGYILPKKGAKRELLYPQL